MIKIVNKKKCCGCTACYNICPVQAILMQPDEEGFLYPKIDEKLCVNCGMCERVCPILEKKTHEELTGGYIIRHKDPAIVAESTSGGAFTAFAIQIINDGGIVYGTGYDENMQVVCKQAKETAELAEMRGSKFVQSNLKHVFSQIEEQLKNGITVLFTGTPCQVEGLISYLQKKPDNLICIDFVCRGVASPKLWENYVETMQKKYNSKMIAARFKNKTYGYHATTMKIDFENGKTWYGSGRIDPMMKAFVNEMASRPSCSECDFKEVKRISDITMFDCYKFSKITESIDDEKGYSSILVHTEKGKVLLDKVYQQLIFCKKVEVEKLIAENGIMACNSAKPDMRREKFYECVQSEQIDIAMKKINPITIMDYFIERTKRIIYKTGLIKLAKKIKNEKGVKI